MMNRTKVVKMVVLLIFLGTFTKAVQASDTLYFAGNIKDARKVSFKYIIRFTVDSANNVTGYSLTDPKGPFETKTRIKGSYDTLNKTLSFEETKILRTRVDTVKTGLCFVKSTLKFKKTKYVETLDGDFSGFVPGQQGTCSEGEIKLINTDRIKKIEKEKEEAEKAKNGDGGK